MQAFLANLKNDDEEEEKVLQKSKLCIVLGNEACDLDSAVSALSLAFYYQVIQNQIQCSIRQSCVKSRDYLPVMNIPREDFVLKTEVDFAFNKYGINANLLTFIDEIDNEDLESSEFIIVDHHVSPYISQCIEVYDHRPIDDEVDFPKDCKVRIEPVGSCATIIADMILNHSQGNDYIRAVCGFAVLSLLRNAIILDTVNFNPSAKRATPKDIEVCEALEKAIEKAAERPLEPRKRLFDELVQARSDVDSLTALQILRKDLKILSHGKSGTNIALCGFPISFKRFIELEDAESSIEQFSEKYNAAVIVLFSINIVETDEREYIEREIGFINVSANDLKDAIADGLRKCKNPNLMMDKYQQLNFADGEFYKQKNLTATRKHITPIIQTIIDAWWVPDSDSNLNESEG